MMRQGFLSPYLRLEVMPLGLINVCGLIHVDMYILNFAF